MSTTADPAAPASAPPGSEPALAPMSRREVLQALSGLFMGMFVAILAATIVSNALPVIIPEIGGSQSVSTMTPPISGPPTVATAKIAPNTPAYRPSSRGGIIAAITICTSAVRPPAPAPWITRATISVVVSSEKPAGTQPLSSLECRLM